MRVPFRGGRRLGRVRSPKRPGGTAAPVEVIGTSGFTATGGGSYLSVADGSAFQDRDGITAICYFRLDALPGGARFLFAKGNAGDYRIQITAGDLVCRSVGGGIYEYPWRAEDVGRTFIVAFSKSNAAEAMYLYRQGDQRAIQIETTGTATVSTSAQTLAIGTRSGNSPTGEAEEATVIGAGIWDAALSKSEVTTLFAACASAGFVDKDAVANAEGVWNAANGWVNDVNPGTHDMAATENTPGDLTDETFVPTYAGTTPAASDVGILGAAQQSNGEGRVTEASWPSPYDATDAVSPVSQFWNGAGAGTSFIDLAPLGDNAMSAEQVFMRDLKSTFPGRTLHYVRSASGGTDLATDWEIDPTPGSQWNAASARIEAAIAARNPLDWMPFEAAVHIQGEADASDATKAANYQVNLDAFIDDLRDYLDSIDALGTNFLYVIVRLSDNNTDPHLSTVQAAMDAVAAARSDTVIVNTDAMTLPDGIHYDQASLQAIGVAVTNAIATRSDQTA